MAFRQWAVLSLAAGLLACGSGSVLGSGLPPAGGADAPLTAPRSTEMTALAKRYVLHLHHLHTGESIDVVYRVGNTYLPEAMEKLNYFLRDHRTQDEITFDPKEFDLLHQIMSNLRRPGGVIDIVCGYRTPESNEYLRTRAPVTGVAEHSQHMEGHAIDIRVPGVSTAMLRKVALGIGAGGVGYYPVSQFVHVDVGPVREWQFGGWRRLHRVRAAAVRHSTHRRRG